MKSLLLLFVPVCLLFSCKKDDTIPVNEDITSGSRWGIMIGSTPEQVYGQLQDLPGGLGVKAVYSLPRHQYVKVSDFQGNPALYNTFMIHQIDSAGVVQIEYNNNISRIRWSGSDGIYPLQRWPAGTTAYLSVGDGGAALQTKMSEIFKAWPYHGNYEISMGNKPLTSGFDLEMKKWDTWQFATSAPVSATATGVYVVTLHFSSGKLGRINLQYQETPSMIE